MSSNSLKNLSAPLSEAAYIAMKRWVLEPKAEHGSDTTVTAEESAEIDRSVSL